MKVKEAKMEIYTTKKEISALFKPKERLICLGEEVELSNLEWCVQRLAKFSIKEFLQDRVDESNLESSVERAVKEHLLQGQATTDLREHCKAMEPQLNTICLLYRYKMWLLLLAAFAIQGILSSRGAVPQRGNPEAYMNISEIIRHKGYQAEEYDIVTSDGYILTLNRIPYDRKQHWNLSGKPAVLLQHGFVLEGRIWVANMPNQSLGFMLADAGYDVWIGNNRGNSWSRKHQHLSTKQDQYHAYSFDEMARYDLPAMISFIVEKTRNSKIHLVGYSQGATQGLIALSSMPHVAEKIRMFHALAPATTIKNSQSPITKLLFLADDVIKGLLGRRDFCPRSEILRKKVIRMCSSKIYSKLCSWGLSVIGGFNQKNLNLSRMDVYMSYCPDSTSIQTLLHWGQIHKTGQFRAFDYGNGNMERYNQDEPPSYNLEHITVPTSIWYAENDWLVNPDNVKALIDQLRSVVYKTGLSDWNHIDFIWGLDAHKRVYSPLIELISLHV
ncbi:lipase member M-like [Candoia aspera]|uniref:lipase member M-like n=1 Tax=Candoia aspera TaxID=51853 RepID=UPI002FD86D32